VRAASVLRGGGAPAAEQRCDPQLRADEGAGHARGARIDGRDGVGSRRSVWHFDGRPFYGNYWVIELEPNYRWALVAEPKGQYLWLLARTPKLEPAVEADVMRRIEAAGYPLSALIKPANERPSPPR
jgi:apolipoprotein D and lipocalin family protein